MKYEIMTKILTRLLIRRKVTAGELAESYGVSVRSIYRYIEELCVCGVPVEIERGRYGGISLADTYRLPSGYMTEDEYAATVKALDAMASQINDENLLSAREKLKSKLKTEKRNLSVCGNIIVDSGTWSNSRQFSEKMRVCEQAVNESRSLLVDYIARGGERSKRVIDPHVLVFKQNVWYVYAFCHIKQQFRTFKIGRIRSASFTGNTFEKKNVSRDEMDLDFTYSDDEFVEVTLEIAPDSIADAEEWIGIDNIEPRGGIYVAEVPLKNDSTLVNKILGFGGAVKVISPAELGERVKAAALNIYRN